MKNKIIRIIILAGMMSVTIVSNTYADNAISQGIPAQLILNTDLAIADAQVSTVTPIEGSTQIVLQGTLDNDGTFKQLPGTRAEFNFTANKGITDHVVWFQNIKQSQPDREWFQDVKIVFENGSRAKGYYAAPVDTRKSVIYVCSNPAQPSCLRFRPFGQSLQLTQSTTEITYYLMDPVVQESCPSIMFQFKLNPCLTCAKP